jgi:hypothetical protein
MRKLFENIGDNRFRVSREDSLEKLKKLESALPEDLRDTVLVFAMDNADVTIKNADKFHRTEEWAECVLGSLANVEPLQTGLTPFDCFTPEGKARGGYTAEEIQKIINGIVPNTI